MKYYLVNYTVSIKGGTVLHPFRCAMYEFDDYKNPKECYDFIMDDLKKHDAFTYVITDMKLIK
jgi:hypothetical protein